MVQGFIGHDVDVVFYLKCNGKPEKVVKTGVSEKTNLRMECGEPFEERQK